MATPTLNTEILEYSEWRSQLSDSIQNMSSFLKENNITDLRTHHQFETAIGALADDNLTVAFVAEFSRGKSEIINTLFFGNYKQRVLPSGSGRTTMSPTELMYDPNLPTSVRLLPIESRKDERPLFEMKNDESLWTEIKFDPEDIETLSKAVEKMTDSKLVSKTYAKELNFDLLDGDESSIGLPVNKFDEVEIPSWRHAIINLPHPLLEQGLVILDTPGLNAIGTEPELTINQLLTAHTVVFILSNDTGVTATDLSLWEQHISVQNTDHEVRQNRLVALNKIDVLWDGIRTEAEIEKEITTQIEQTSKTLKLDKKYIFPISAQKGLLGKLSNDAELVYKSRVLELEHAIADQLIPQKKQIVLDKVENTLGGVIDSAKSILDTRLKDADEHIAELKQLSSKNVDVISHIMVKVQSEKSSLETDMKRYTALRSVYTKQTGKLSTTLSSERLERLIARTKHNMTRCASSMTLQKTISQFFERINLYLEEATKQANEIALLSEDITQDFEQEHGITNFTVRRLQLNKYKQEIERLESKHSDLKETKTLFFREQVSIANRFYESVCTESRAIFERARRRSNNWNNNIMVPMETHVKDHHAQLRRRLESVKRIHKASDTVEARLNELKVMQSELIDLHSQFNDLQTNFFGLINSATNVVEAEVIPLEKSLNA